MRAKGAAIAIAIAIVIVALIVLARASAIVVDLLWFSSLGYRDVFWTVLETRSLLFISVFVLSATAYWASAALALRYVRHPSLPSPLAAFTRPQGYAPGMLHGLTQLPRRIIISLGVVVLAGLTAFAVLPSWDTVLLFLYQVPFGATDPVFANDLAFYLFTLPALVALKNWLMALVLLAASVAASIYWAHGDIALDRGRPWFSRGALAHASVLLGLYFLLKALSYLLDRWLLLYSDNGVVVGAG